MWDRFRGAVPQKLGRSHQQRRDTRQQQQQSQQYGSRGDAFTGGGTSETAGYSYSIQGGMAPRRPPREFFNEQTQYYPDEQSASPQEQPPRRPNRDSSQLEPPRFRPASSIYSAQPSPIQTDFTPAAPNRSFTFHEYLDVSPPSSPEPFTPDVNGPPLPIPDISPIDEDEEPLDEMSQQRGQMRTLQLPQQQRAVSGARRGYAGGEVRWDPSTGELTSSEKGRPSQVKPAEYAKGFGHGGPESDMAGRGASSSPEGSTPFGQRLRRIAPPGFVTGGAERKVSTGGDTMSPRTRQLSPSPSPSPSSSPTPRRVTSPTSSTAQDPAAGAFMAERPPWKGASGRTALVAPVHDDPETAPLNVPRRRGPKQSPTTSNTAAHALASPPASPLVPETQTRSLESTAQQTASSSQHGAVTGYPSPPYSGHEGRSQSRAETSNLPATTLQSPPAAMSPISPATTIRRKPAPSTTTTTTTTTTQSHHPQDSVASTTSQNDAYNYQNYTTVDPPSAPAPTAAAPTAGSNSLGVPDGWVQPPSRFSVSTYATSSQATPRPSTDGYYDDNDIDADYHGDSYATLTGWNHAKKDTRAAADTTTTKQESVMDRRRPKLGGGGGSGASSLAGDQSPVVISLKDAQWSTSGAHRKPAGSGAGNNNSSGGSSGDEGRPESIMSMAAGSIYKSLPPAPPETSAVGRVDAINARLLALANRRINISRSVKQMTELMPTDNILASAEVLRKREVERRKVDALRAELAEVQREEYELGIKLHRAYKRIDREAHYEPTTLWVRRVTG
ncbi:hypothetical protein MAPG_04235 [Magnaporthiopsis poae ATCC 64411]|uniref:Uncharacterized protein n=1 Tax=Magnaporthiopsis poae (strain ATCC 64411 / 73-15) TaxID=644358 RepID=A0A0C4DW61_MAGP6|nr:hypothetical protein MAPG_04235 [Magnaporthiopsis poae ATCC 64411]